MVGESYTLMLTTLVVFAVAHLWLALSVDKKMALDEKAEKYTKVFSTLYNIGLALMATGFVVAVLFPLFGLVTGLIDLDEKEVTQTVTMGVITGLLLGVMMCYQIRAFSKLPKWLYTMVMGVVTVVAIVLFAIFPAGEIRGVVNDQKIIDDLMIIEQAVDNYVSNRNKLPSGLDDLKLKDLNRKVDDYEYKVKSGGSSYYYNMSYTLCTNGFITDTSVDYFSSFYSHKKGRNCFDLEAYGSYYHDDGFGEIVPLGPEVNYNDYNYDYDYDL
jgi:hypothetical protein